MKKTLSLAIAAALLICTIGSNVIIAESASSKWSESLTEDGWMRVTNEGGATLGYHPETGIRVLVEDGFAFKDMAGNGELYPFMDWRLDAGLRAEDLAARLNLEQLSALMLSSAVAPAYNTAEEQIRWANELQADAEKSDPFSLPVNVITDSVLANLSNRPDGLALASTFDPSLAAEYADALSAQLRALGIHTYLGPTADLATEPRWYRVSKTFGEDPALAKDMVQAIVNSLQSSYDSNGIDTGWGAQSVSAVLMQWPGAGPSEGGRAASRWWGAFNVYPGGQFDTHTIPFVDGGLTLDGLTEKAAGVMSAYSIVWDEEGETLASSFNYDQNQLLRSYGFDGIIYADWGVQGELGHGSDVQYFSPHERILLAILAGTDAFVDLSGTANINYVHDAVTLGIELLEGNYEEPTGEIVIEGEKIELEYSEEDASSETKEGSADLRVVINPLETLLPVLSRAFSTNEALNAEEAMRARLEDSARRVLANAIRMGLFENPYIESSASLIALSSFDQASTSADAQEKAIIMLKNNGVIAENKFGSKPKVYVPMTLNIEDGDLGNEEPDWTVGTRVPVEELEKYFEVITDTAADYSENATPEDIIRAGADKIAEADFALVFMESPINALDSQNNGVQTSAFYPTIAPWDYHFINIGHIQYFPISMQYRTYRATNDNVRQPSLAGRSIWWFLVGVYGDDASHEDESRAYFGQRTSAINSYEYDLLLDVVDLVPDGVPVIVAMNADRGYVFSEIEEDVDAILIGFDVDYQSFLPIVFGSVEPSGLLPIQMPLNMTAVEGQSEDVPRDMDVYMDSMGNAYDFAFGLDWSGKIEDSRTEKYDAPALTSPEGLLNR